MIVRPSRPLHSQPRCFSRSRRAALVAASVASVLLGTIVSFDVNAQASSASAVSAASAPDAASAAGAVTQYSVKPGQSLSDIASQITGSNDRATREKMARALFDANPNAFMGHDPSRLKLGSVLNVPPVEDVGAASAASAASASAPVATSAPAVEASGSVGAAAPAEGASNTVGAAMAASGAVTPNASSEANALLPTSEAQPAANASEAVSASEVAPASAVASSMPAETAAPASAPSTTGSLATSVNGPIGWIAGAVVVIVGLLLLVMRAGKRRRATSAASAVTEDDRSPQEPPVLSTAPETAAILPDDGSASHAQSPTGAADLDGASVERGQSELNVVAASIENYDAAQSFETPTEDAPFPPAGSESINEDAAADARVTLSGTESREQHAANTTREADTKRAPFMPDAPAALHRDFTPPRPGAIEAALAAERSATDRAEALRVEMEAREQELREAAALEQATREAVAQEAAAREIEAREAAAREAAAREAEAREAAANEAAAHEAEAREAATREAATREAAAREAAAREAEAREAEAREVATREAAAREATSLEEAARASGTHESAEHGASAQSSAPEHPADQPHSLQDSSDYDDEPSPASRFPQPKFPQEAIEALSALDFGLPPRQEAPSPSNVQPTLPAASATEHPSPTESTEHNETTPVAEPPIAAAPVTPQPIADPAVFDRQNAQHRHPESTSTSASEQIESGTTGAASVAGLGASRFGPLSLDFDYNSPTSQTEPLPAFTPEQISSIARNKLELAVEYIELGDLSGARTLLQEVIESNDPATRQPAAALLSTLAPLS
jgi:pilus assembly protein FimV